MGLLVSVRHSLDSVHVHLDHVFFCVCSLFACVHHAYCLSNPSAVDRILTFKIQFPTCCFCTASNFNLFVYMIFFQCWQSTVLVMRATRVSVCATRVSVCACNGGFLLYAADMGASTQSDELSWQESVLLVLCIIFVIILIFVILILFFKQQLVKCCKWICLCLPRSSWNTVLAPRCRKALWQNGKIACMWPGVGRGIRMENADFLSSVLVSSDLKIFFHCCLFERESDGTMC